MMEHAHTPLATLRRARAIARRAGLKFVYTGNLTDREGEETRCAGCGELLAARDRYEILAYRVVGGACPSCHRPVPGHWPAEAGDWGARRERVQLP
jgi:pyruvate formate lyase activating enzyme